MTILPHWAYYPKSYNVNPVPPGIHLYNEINGDLSKDVWRAADWSDPFGDIQGKDSPSSQPQPALTQFKALYDDSYLYIGAILHPSPDVPATQAHFVHRNDPIFQKDSDFEVFIDVTGCNHQYKELELNAINTIWNLLLDKPYRDGGVEHSGRIAQPGDPLYYDVKFQKTAVRVLQGTLNDPKHGQALWSVEMALAYKDLFVTLSSSSSDDSTACSKPSFLSPSPQPGDFWRINFSRVEEQGKINWTWQPQVVWDPEAGKFRGVIDMHAPDAYGYFYFTDNQETTAETTNRPAARDPTWPLRLTAMHIYHAQRAYFERRNNHQYASSVQDLTDLVDPAIVEPFDIYILLAGQGQEYTVLVKSTENDNVATVKNDRLLVVQRFQPDMLEQFKIS